MLLSLQNLLCPEFWSLHHTPFAHKRRSCGRYSYFHCFWLIGCYSIHIQSSRYVIFLSTAFFFCYMLFCFVFSCVHSLRAQSTNCGCWCWLGVGLELKWTTSFLTMNWEAINFLQPYRWNEHFSTFPCPTINYCAPAFLCIIVCYYTTTENYSNFSQVVLFVLHSTLDEIDWTFTKV